MTVRTRSSSSASAEGSSERMSISKAASAGMELTDVPPLRTLTLNVVFGLAATSRSAIAATARPSACAGLGIPNAP